MESATVAAQGYRFRVPYGTLLCVSDKPLHGEIKLPGQANAFYERAISQHLQIGIETLANPEARGRQAPFPQAARVRRSPVPLGPERRRGGRFTLRNSGYAPISAPLTHRRNAPGKIFGGPMKSL